MSLASMRLLNKADGFVLIVKESIVETCLKAIFEEHLEEQTV